VGKCIKKIYLMIEQKNTIRKLKILNQ